MCNEYWKINELREKLDIKELNLSLTHTLWPSLTLLIVGIHHFLLISIHLLSPCLLSVIHLSSHCSCCFSNQAPYQELCNCLSMSLFHYSLLYHLVGDLTLLISPQDYIGHTITQAIFSIFQVVIYCSRWFIKTSNYSLFSSTDIDLKSMVADQPNWDSTELNNLELAPFDYFHLTTNEEICDISTSKPQPLVPMNHKHSVFSVLHNLSHPRIAATLKLILAHLVQHA